MQHAFSLQELDTLALLTSPASVQAFLDSVPYSTEARYRSPRTVLRDRRAHCFDGALFAAAALRRLGFPPLIVDMFADNDDEHLIAPFKRDGRWGAVAKSNFVGLRYRDPVYRSLRELVMSYFELYFNANREKTLRSYTRPLDLRAFDRYNWMADDKALERIADRTDRLQRIPLLTPEIVAALMPVDERSYQAGMLGLDPAGLYRPTQR
ncbi:MAG: hypothetical protein GX601_08380 [Anaerolineales bacterium]|nr:hypothetical protein [Anaerolineales bacterium]